MREAVIVSGARTPVGKANRGAFAHVRSDDLGAIAVKETIRRANGVDPTDIEDVIIGCAMPEAEQGMNMARNLSVLAGIPQSVPAVTINRYCASGLQTIAYGAERIMLGQSKMIIAGGAESMSMIPIGGHVIKPNPKLIDEAPEYYMSMGYTAEEVARQYDISDRIRMHLQPKVTVAQLKPFQLENLTMKLFRLLLVSKFSVKMEK